jgi:hypothetical protein
VRLNPLMKALQQFYRLRPPAPFHMRQSVQDDPPKTRVRQRQARDLQYHVGCHGAAIPFLGSTGRARDRLGRLLLARWPFGGTNCPKHRRQTAPRRTRCWTQRVPAGSDRPRSRPRGGAKPALGHRSGQHRCQKVITASAARVKLFAVPLVKAGGFWLNGSLSVSAWSQRTSGRISRPVTGAGTAGL